jgi:hypothetical protein
MPFQGSAEKEYTQQERPLVVERDVKLLDPSDL